MSRVEGRERQTMECRTECRELYCLKVWQISKDYARSREITNEPYMRLNYEYTDNLYLREISQRKTLSKN